MAYKNVTRQENEDVFYHVYNRGVSGMEIFKDDEDYRYFERLLARHLSDKPTSDKYGREYANFSAKVELHTYCLMPNHYHFLFHQIEKRAIEQLMSTIVTPYSLYFNKKYKRRGPLYESPYKAVCIEEDSHLMHVSRYIHLNPVGYSVWEHSSYNDYLYNPREWIKSDFILGMFSSRQEYLEYVEDYESIKRESDRLKADLGDC